MTEKYVLVFDRPEKEKRVMQRLIGRPGCYVVGNALRYLEERGGSLPQTQGSESEREWALRTQEEFENGRAEESDVVIISGGMGKVATLFDEDNLPREIEEGMENYDGVFFIGKEVDKKTKEILQTYEKFGYPIYKSKI